MEKGCEDCGYKDDPAFLHFHHKDPSTKKLKVSSLLTYGFDKIDAEIAKCSVKCQWCHEEFHGTKLRRG